MATYIKFGNPVGRSELRPDDEIQLAWHAVSCLVWRDVTNGAA